MPSTHARWMRTGQYDSAASEDARPNGGVGDTHNSREARSDSATTGESARNPSRDPAAMLADAAERSADTEFFSPLPPGYRKGRHKYVVVFGTVMSGLGKGIFASSVAKLLKDKSLVVAPMKLEGYLNIDAGLLNPFRHGEVFVLDDGTECDMDLGTYERILDQDLCKKNFTTSGQIFSEILERERHGAYLGRDVQMIPHVTGEVKRRIRELALYGDGKGPADVVFVEVGGTVGDYENGFYIEALRELAFEEGEGSVCFVALTYIIKPQTLGEQKSKAAQLGIKRLMEAGIQPHIIACRAAEECSDMVMQKIAMFSNVPMRRVFSMHDRESIYTIPDEMRREGLDREILSILDLHDRVNIAHEDRSREDWSGFVTRLTRKKPRSVTIGLTGKYIALRDAYASIDKAIEHCTAYLNCEVDLKWIETTDISDENVEEQLKDLDGVIVPGGFGSRGVEGKIRCVRYCRENSVPYLGICLGFQVAVIEYARNVLGLKEANSTEFKPGCSEPLISELPEQKKIEGLGGSMRLGGQDVEIVPGSLAAHLYFAAGNPGASIQPPGSLGYGYQTSRTNAPLRIRERFRHRYEVDPRYVEALEQAGMHFSGRHPRQPIMQILELAQPTAASSAGQSHYPRTSPERERVGPANQPAIPLPDGRGSLTHGGTGASSNLPTHPYFIGGQFHPELTSRPLRPQPMFLGLVAAAIRHRYPEVDALAPTAEPTLARWLRIRPEPRGTNTVTNTPVSTSSGGMPVALHLSLPTSLRVP